MREQWQSRFVFVLATMASAVGLGNVWRFPYMCYKYGGGAFLIPYFIALFTTGIPIMILELGLGHKTRLAAPNAFTTLGKNKEWVGWFALLMSFGIIAYYAVIMGWTLNYLKYSFTLAWGKEEEEIQNFFFNKFLGISDSPFNIGKIRIHILVSFLISWVFIISSIWHGPKTVGKVIYFTGICPVIILIILLIRGVTLPGAIEGLNYYLTPNFKALKDFEVWRAAYGQVFFSLSLGFGIMIAYASFLPEKSDIVNNAFIICLADAGMAFLSGLVVFSCLGYYAYELNTPVLKVVRESLPLAFIAYPTIINLLPVSPQLIGVLFFLMLATLAVDSAFSGVEAIVAGVCDKWKIKKEWLINIIVGLICIAVGLIYTTNGGLYWIDITDRYTNIGLIIIGLTQCLIVGYSAELFKLKQHCNTVSEIKIGRWWDICIKIISPTLIFLFLLFFVIEEIKKPYENYPDGAIGIGILILGAFFIFSVLLMKIRGSKKI